MYVVMEDDVGDGFADTPVAWNRMQSGYQALIRRYPKSDVILNRFAGFACRAHDLGQYSQLRPKIDKRYSSTAWTTKHSLESCDRWFSDRTGRLAAAKRSAEAITPIQTLGGIRLGMTQTELLAAKGQPINQALGQWVYESANSRHGRLTVTFSPSASGSDGTVQSIEYTGYPESAPSELPFLSDFSSVDVIQRYGPQVTGHLILKGKMSFLFPNHVYVDTLDEKVYQYGITNAK
jgi:hypothetical protein